jgi:hypothetical protein
MRSKVRKGLLRVLGRVETPEATNCEPIKPHLNAEDHSHIGNSILEAAYSAAILGASSSD